MDYTNQGMSALNAMNGLQQAQAGAKQKPPETRAETVLNRLDVLGKQLREVRGMTFAATERLLGAEPTPVNQSVMGGAEQAATPFMARTENAIGDLERLASEIREELGRINRTFG